MIPSKWMKKATDLAHNINKKFAQVKRNLKKMQKIVDNKGRCVVYYI